MKIIPIQKTGECKRGDLSLIYSKVVEKVGEPNVTHIDDCDKVKASWGFKDENGRKGFIWAYRWGGKISNCNRFSVDGDKELLTDLFGNQVSFYL